MKLAVGEILAQELVRQLESVCERIEVAGSIRRKKVEVKDIELVVVPRFEERLAPSQTSFLEPTPEFLGRNLVSRLEELVGRWREEGRARPRLDKNGRQAIGERYKRLLVEIAGPELVPVDLFVCLPPAQFGLLFLIRTGADVFSQAMLRRWKQVSGGGRSAGGCLHLPDGSAVVTPEEPDCFVVCQVVWVPPEQRVSAAAVRAVDEGSIHDD